MRQAKSRLLSVIVVSVSANNLQSLVVYTYHKETSLHVGNSRHVGYIIILLVPTERVLRILKFLPLTSSVLLWVLVEEMLLKFELNYYVIIDMCEKASYFKTKNNTAANANKVTPLSIKLYFNFASTLLREF